MTPLAVGLQYDHNRNSENTTNFAPPTSTEAGLMMIPHEILRLKENEVVFREGESPRGVYMVRSGAVKVMVNRTLTRGRVSSPEFVTKLVGAGEFFGFKSLIKGKELNFHAKTATATEIYVFPKEAIQQLMNSSNLLLRVVLQQMVRDLENFEMNTQLHYLASVQERIAFQLYQLSEKFGQPTANGIVINLRLTRNELAQMAGTINESLSRHLTELKNEGVIDLNGREIVIKNKEALKIRSGNFK